MLFRPLFDIDTTLFESLCLLGKLFVKVSFWVLELFSYLVLYVLKDFHLVGRVGVRVRGSYFLLSNRV